MADKSTTSPIGICKDVRVLVANVTILTIFLILDMPEDYMSIILGIPFLKPVGAVIDCNKSKVNFHVNGKQHKMHFPKKHTLVNNINAIEPIVTVTIRGFKIPLPTTKKKYYTLIIEDMQIPIEVT